ncbi:MAG: DUF3179 domain-containing (seleno)protein, partial [Balneolaceae bacterium]
MISFKPYFMFLFAALFVSTSRVGIAQDARFTGWKTDLTKRNIDLEELQAGGPPKDGIPSIDDPRFIGPGAADSWLEDREPVIALEIDGKARAYPLQILIWHEIVNDELKGE